MPCREALALIILAQRGDPIPPWAPFIFVGGWFVVGFVISRLGWSSFATAHGDASRPPGPAYTSPHTQFGDWRASYNNVVRVVPCERGLWICVMFLFRAFHPPFLLPWRSVVRVQRLSGWFIRGYRVHVEDDSAGTIKIHLWSGFKEALAQFRPDLLTEEP